MKKNALINVRGRSERVLDEWTIGRKRYALLEQLGSHGRFRVFDPSAGMHGDYRVVSLLPRDRRTEQQVEVLRRFAERNLHFPKIVECVRRDSDLAIISTWVWGQSLRQFLADVRDGKCPRPSPREAVRLIARLAHGVAHLHSKANVVHGDIKPANLVLENHPTRLTLIDFGSAWPAERATKKTPGDGASAPYAAPEQFGGPIIPDFRADYFSLAVVLYELLTLEIPFDGVGGQAGLPEFRAAFADKYAPPCTKIADVHLFPTECRRALDNVLARGLALDPGRRFAGRSELLSSMDSLFHQFRDGTRLGFVERKIADLLAWWGHRS